jgi:protein required for attachment to host cells
MRAPTTWVVIANGARARVFDFRPADRSLELVHETASDDARRKTSEIMSDRAGRMWDTGPGQRSGMEPPTDPQEHAKAEFLRELADWLEKAATEQRYDRLVLVAEPQALGHLRQQLGKPAAEKVTGELAKDLTQHAPRDLGRHLDDVV